MNRNTSKTFWKKSALLGTGIFLSHMAFSGASFSPAQAQPDMNDAPKADNPPENKRPNRDRNQGGNIEAFIRRMMTQAGVADAATQDAVLAYMKTDMEARRPLRDQGTKLFQALRAGAVTDDQLLALMTDYRASQQADKARREQAEAALDAKINFSKNPRLEAMLLLSGVIGDGGPMMGGGWNGGGRGGQNGNGRNGQNGNNQNGNGQNGAQGAGDNAQKREEREKKMLQRFDKNNDGKLDEAEEAAAKQWREERKAQREKEKAGQQPAVAMPGDA